MKKQIWSVFLIFMVFQTTHAQSFKDIDGFWKARGYGWIMDISSGKATIYDITQLSCLPSMEYPISFFSDSYFVEGKTLTVKRGVTEYNFDRLQQMPELCSKRLSKKERNNPILNFEILWNTFHEQYVYFEERGVDWQMLYDKYRAQIKEDLTDPELYAICRRMLEELDDGHVSIVAPKKIRKKAAIINNRKKLPNADFTGLRRALVDKYLKTPNTHNLSRVVWGKINDKVGYIQLNGMEALADYGITPDMTSKEATKIYRKKLIESPNPLSDQIAGVKSAMQKVILDLGDTEQIIMDLRFNRGGEDMVGLTALSHLVDEEKTVFSKKHRIGNSYSATYDYRLAPAENTYQGKLTILQSHWSVSAAEIMLLASLKYDDIERMGSPSEGAFSDILPKVLPNGWDFGLSNQVYLDAEGVSYEAKGIPVNVDLNYPEDEHEFVDKLKRELNADGDTAIQRILDSKK